MSKKEETYEEQVRREFEATQDEQETFKDLGKVNLNGGININDDPEIKRVNDVMDYINIPLDTLPSQGRYYPENTRISIRSARVNEIRQFSMIDESDPIDLRDKLTYIMSQCIKVYYGNTPGHYKDILEDDRIPLVLKIRELTFKEGQSSIKMEVPSGACKTPGCHPQEYVFFSSNKLEFKKPSEKLEKYYDSAQRCYIIPTKRFGTLRLSPPTVGVTNIMAEWITEQQRQNKEFDASLANFIPYIIKDWRTFSTKQVFTKLTELAGWSTEKFALVLGLTEEISIGIEFEITETCAQCGGELRIPITFPEGYRSLFVPPISDLGDELL